MVLLLLSKFILKYILLISSLETCFTLELPYISPKFRFSMFMPTPPETYFLGHRNSTWKVYANG